MTQLDNHERIKELLNLLPQPPDENIPDGIIEEDINDFFQKTTISIPKQLEAWLRISNGPFVDSQALFGINKNRKFQNIYSYYQLYPSWLNNNWIPIGTDGSGNFYLIATINEFGPGYPVFFIDVYEGIERPSYIVASDISHFLEFLFEKELKIDTRWPFNEKYVVQKDPMILTFQNIPLPWQ